MAEMLKQQKSLNSFLFVILFIIPLVCVAGYELLVASDRYESKASLFITKENQSQSPLDLSLLGITNSGSIHDILIMKEFIESPGMLARLEKKLGMKQHFSNPEYDYLSRLKKNPTREELLSYYLSMLHVKFDDEAKILRISVQSFDRQFAKSILETILNYSQSFIDELNENVTNAQLQFFKKEVSASEHELSKNKKTLVKFQQDNKILTTEIAAQSITNTISTLEQTLAQKKSALTARRSSLAESSPQIRRLKEEIIALEHQISAENKRLSGSSGKSLSSLDAELREITFLISFATNRYKANLEALEKARLEAARRLKFLTIVSPPTLADESEYPRRAYIIGTAAIIFMALYLIVSLIVVMIREHS